MIPVTLGGSDYKAVIPENVLTITGNLRHFVVENIRSARRYLRLIDKRFPLDDCVFAELNEHTSDAEIPALLEPVLKGIDIGLMSEAGLAGVADPGSKLIYLAHLRKVRVIPLSGPSSVILALISSGLNGQKFRFNGYLPVKEAERSSMIKKLETESCKGYSQIFMETPYRNREMVNSILHTCRSNTLLCIAVDITLNSESIRTMTISEWKKNVPDLKNRLAIFILQQNH